jgi:carbon-monoxide dehydrogenase medium subunit
MHVNEVNTHIMPVQFEYHAPTSLREALELLSKHGGEAAPLAGGTDLLVKMKQRLVEPRHVINIKNVPELSGIEERGDEIHIGAATKLRAIEKSEIVRARLPLLQEAVRTLGSVQIRNMATIGGNLCNASPAADTATALLALDAKAHMVSSEGTRTVPLEEFFTGPGRTVLKQNELLAEVSSPRLPEDCGTAFIKIGRTSLDVATVNVAVMLRLEGEVVGDCRIALGAVAPTPIRVHRAEEVLKGKELTDETLKTAARIASESIKPITDIRATADYRKQASETLLRDALMTAKKRAQRR